MATPTIIVLLAAVLGTLAAVGFVGLVQVDRLRRSWDRVTDQLERLTSAREELDVQLAVLERERARLQGALDAFQAQREMRRGASVPRW
ncbi:MAG: hypothetical protein JJT89_11350 [Nitriliruptoraceae bacterium]|nr:hypothetical protein [Nitriliruptoraceae bacterium]